MSPKVRQRFDDVENDAAFPAHCLIRVRARLRTLLSTVEVLESSLVPSSQRVGLPHSGLSLVPPPRFGQLPQGALSLPAHHSLFTRVAHSVTEQPWLFEAARFQSGGLDLECRARAFYAAWAGQGVVQKSLTLTPAPALGANRSLRASFDGAHAEGAPLLSRARWIDRGDSAVMLSLSVAWADPDESVALVDAAAETIEWLTSAAPSPAAAKARPWWRFW